MVGGGVGAVRAVGAVSEGGWRRRRVGGQSADGGGGGEGLNGYRRSADCSVGGGVGGGWRGGDEAVGGVAWGR